MGSVSSPKQRESTKCAGCFNCLLRDVEAMKKSGTFTGTRAKLKRALLQLHPTEADPPDYILSEPADRGYVWNLIAYASYRLERFDEALVAAKNAVHFDPTNSGAWEIIGAVSWETGDPKAAAEAYAFAVSLCKPQETERLHTLRQNLTKVQQALNKKSNADK
jgi:tetratricopeptide (TPR) repeat protein